MLTYHEIKKESPELARKLVRKILKQNQGNVSKTALILGIHRATVRRARDGCLHDKSKRPHNSKNKTSSSLEKMILKVAKDTGYRYRRLSFYLFNAFGVFVSENTIKGILKRNNITPKRIRTKNRSRRHLYDYKHLLPFAEMQLDTKHILDQNALPKDVYNHIQSKNLPLYEWNIIDMATRTRFTAYSHELSALYGKMFISFILTWIRSHGIHTPVHIQADNGLEFCIGSKRKEIELNQFLTRFNASFTSIPAGKKYLQGVIERSHRSDDEEFLAIYPSRCNNSYDFIHYAQRWQDTWNAGRPHFGIDMNGLTPLDKLRKSNILCPENLLRFPVLLMEDLLPFSYLLTGQYVLTNYRKISRGI